MAADILEKLLIANVALAAAILLVFLLRSPVRWIAGSRVVYFLWLIPLLAVLGSLLPAPNVAVRFEERPQAVAIIAPGAAPNGALERPMSAPAVSLPAEPELNLNPMVLAIWLAGAAIAALALVSKHRAALRGLGEMKAEGEGMLRSTGETLGPAVVGILSPRIVLPADFETRYDPAEQAAVIAHEKAHLAGRHVAAKALVQAIVCLNWFNPFVHFAANAVAVDQELACDEVVIGADPLVKKTYAEALLKTQTGCVLPLGCYWPAQSNRLLRMRICLVCAGAKGPVIRWGGAIFASVLALGGGIAAWGAQPPRFIDFQDTRAEIVSLAPTPGPTAANIVARDARMIARSVDLGKTRDAIVFGGTAADAVKAMRKEYVQKGWKTDMLPTRETARFAAFADGEFGVAGKTADGRFMIVNDGGFDEYPHPAGLPTPQRISVVRSGQFKHPPFPIRPPVGSQMQILRYGGVPVTVEMTEEAPAIPRPPEAVRLAAFSKHDTNRDGRLDWAEYTTLLVPLGYGGQQNDLWPRRDLDKDGFVTPAEYRDPLP